MAAFEHGRRRARTWSCCATWPTPPRRTASNCPSIRTLAVMRSGSRNVVRLAKKVDRRNLGVSFTFCHFLAVDKMKNLASALALARPYLNMATINGTDGFGAGWIKVLGEGSVNVSAVLAALRKIDYRGPIGMIAYGIRGNHRDILARSIKGCASCRRRRPRRRRRTLADKLRRLDYSSATLTTGGERCCQRLDIPAGKPSRPQAPSLLCRRSSPRKRSAFLPRRQARRCARA